MQALTPLERMSIIAIREFFGLENVREAPAYARRPPCALCHKPVLRHQSWHNNGRMVHWKCEMEEMGIQGAVKVTRELWGYEIMRND